MQVTQVSKAKYEELKEREGAKIVNIEFVILNGLKFTFDPDEELEEESVQEEKEITLESENENKEASLTSEDAKLDTQIIEDSLAKAVEYFKTIDTLYKKNLIEVVGIEDNIAREVLKRSVENGLLEAPAIPAQPYKVLNKGK